MSKNKEILGLIKLQVPLGKANPAPPIGPALGQKGLNIMEFCKQFNALKLDYEAGTPIKLAKGSSNPGKDTAGKITMAQIRNVAKKKMVDMNATDLEACASMVRGSALSMGLEVVE